jgi:hypothetical protein
MTIYFYPDSVEKKHLFVSADGLVFELIEYNEYQSKLKPIARLNRMLDFNPNAEPLRLYDREGRCLDFYNQDEIIGKQIVREIEP